MEGNTMKLRFEIELEQLEVMATIEKLLDKIIEKPQTVQSILQFFFEKVKKETP